MNVTYFKISARNSTADLRRMSQRDHCWTSGIVRLRTAFLFARCFHKTCALVCDFLQIALNFPRREIHVQALTNLDKSIETLNSETQSTNIKIKLILLNVFY